MKILLATAGARGDIQPATCVGAALVKLGIEVRQCATPTFRAEVESAGIEYVEYGYDAERELRKSAHQNVGGAFQSKKLMEQMLHAALEDHFVTLEAASEGVDLIVGGGLQALAGESIASLRGVPAASFFYCPSSVPSGTYAPVVFPFPSMPRVFVSPAWKALKLAYVRLFGAAVERHRARLGLSPVDDLLAAYVSQNAVLLTDPELGEAPKDPMIGPVVQPGYVHRPPGARLSPEVERFLDEGERPVYIGFGSMVDPEPVATSREIGEAIRGAGVRAIVGRGWAGLDLPPSRDVHVVDDVPHDLLFRRCAAIVHHGGAGTTASAARAGVPQVIVPHLLDQYFWAHAVEKRGLGPKSINRPRLRAGKLAGRIVEAASSATMAERARALGEILRGRDAAEAAALHLAEIADRGSASFGRAHGQSGGRRATI
jgi:vancomycin aglycone glucosyltransferase